MIRIKNLGFSYTKSVRALDDINLDIDEGEIFALVGPSGAGKSTLQKILINLIKDYDGQVEVLGQDLKLWSSKDYFHQVGVSFELPNHFNALTARENLDYFANLYNGDKLSPEHALSLLGLGDSVDKRVSNFSKGMKTRLGIARALMHKPKLIFMDEPSSGLDPVNTKLVQDLIKAKRDEGCTILLTTHNMTTAEDICDRVAFMVNGRIANVDKPKELMKKHGRDIVTLEYIDGDATVATDFPLTDLGGNSEFLSLLADHPVKTIHSKESSLSDVFIQITGQELA